MAPKAKGPVMEYDGPMEGSGRFFFASGSSYSGSWKMLVPEADGAADGVIKPKRVKHGQGQFQDCEGSYVGSFHEDLFDGDGTFTFSSGCTYSGMWKDGKYCGQGKYQWPDGTSYEGEFVNNVPHGQGTFTDCNSRLWSGNFHNGSGPGLTHMLP